MAFPPFLANFSPIFSANSLKLPSKIAIKFSQKQTKIHRIALVG
jgi:hypothetical protein